MGKSGHIARKNALPSPGLGTPSIFFHLAEALQGDLGTISLNGIVILLSNSGESQEILQYTSLYKIYWRRDDCNYLRESLH